MTLDDATAADLSELHALIERGYRGEPARAGWSNEADLLSGPRTDVAELEELRSDPRRHLLVWRDEGRIVSCVLLSQKGEGLCYLGMLTVEPGMQAKGLGKRMLAAAEELARERLGGRTMEMQVFPQRSELIAFYERRGYRPTGERRPFPYAEAHDAGALRDDLDFIVLEKPL